MLRWLTRRSVERGVWGGDNRWLVVGGVVGLLRVGLHLYRRVPETVAVEVLEPGETLVVEHLPPDRD